MNRIWRYWTGPEHIIHWNRNSDLCRTVRAENDLRKGGRFSYRMEAIGGGSCHDFSGEFIDLTVHSRLVIRLDDGRNLTVDFRETGPGVVEIEERFETDLKQPADIQRRARQEILNSFRAYVEEKEKRA